MPVPAKDSKCQQPSSPPLLLECVYWTCAHKHTHTHIHAASAQKNPSCLKADWNLYLFISKFLKIHQHVSWLFTPFAISEGVMLVHLPSLSPLAKISYLFIFLNTQLTYGGKVLWLIVAFILPSSLRRKNTWLAYNHCFLSQSQVLLLD